MSQKIDLRVEYTNKLAQENEALRAQVEALRAALDSVLNCGDWYSSALEFDRNTDGHFVQSGILKALDATSSQCLAEIKARAVDEFIILFQEHYPTFCTERPFHRPVKMLTACKDIYSNQLRQADKG